MAMRPFMGYNFGKYLDHWCNLKTPVKCQESFMCDCWAGENIRVIDWIVRRLEEEKNIGIDTAIGTIPTNKTKRFFGPEDINWEE